MTESKINPPVTDREKQLIPPSPDKYLPGVHTNPRIEAQKKNIDKRAAKLKTKEAAEKEAALIAAAEAEIDQAPMLDDNLVEEITEKPTPPKAKGPISLLKRWFGGRNDNAQA